MQDFARQVFKKNTNSSPPIKKSFLPRSLWITLGATLVLSVFVLGIIVGQITQLQFSFLSFNNQKKTDTLLRNQSPQDNQVDFAEFWNVWALVNQKHIDGPFDQKKLMYGAIDGMVESTTDPHTTFFTEEEAVRFNESLNGEFEGIGVEVEEKEGKVIILSLLENTPAEQQGLLVGDIIVAVNNQSVEGWKLEEVVLAIRGPKDTKVQITVLRGGSEKNFDITRSKISVPSVLWHMLDDQIAYLKIMQFSDDTSTDFDRLAEEILIQNPRGLILDLRNNRGGYLDAGIHISQAFFQDGIVMKQKSKTEEKDFLVEQPGVFKDIPLVVLINSYSASASEIVAGAIKDRERGTLVGTTSFGKGSIQNIETLANGSQIRITTGKWFTPLGNTVDKKGIEPNVTVALQTSTIVATPPDLTVTPPSNETPSPTPLDDQLQKAIEIFMTPQITPVQNTTELPTQTSTPQP